VAAYESGSKEPRLSTLERLAEAAGYRLETSIGMSGAERARERRRARGLAIAAATEARVRDDWRTAKRVATANLSRMEVHVGSNRSKRWINEWRDLVAQGPRAVSAALLDPSPDLDDLRQMQPFAGLLSDGERRLVLAVAERLRTR
jgi:transcriptional regulator with XRE-family HTH domain